MSLYFNKHPKPDRNHLPTSVGHESHMFPRGHTGAPPKEEDETAPEPQKIKPVVLPGSGSLSNFPLLGLASKTEPSIKAVGGFEED